MSDIVDRIDEQLAQGEPYVEQGPQLCPKCRDDWHALPVTERLRMMRHAGVIDPDYRYSTDTSPVVCEGVPADEAIPRPQVPAPDFGSLYRLVEQLPEMQGRRGGLQWPGAPVEVQAGVLIIPAELEAPRPPFSMLLEMALIDALVSIPEILYVQDADMRDAERIVAERIAAGMSVSTERVEEALQRLREAQETPDPEPPQDPRTRALPRPSTTPPMWANSPQTRHRRRTHR